MGGRGVGGIGGGGGRGRGGMEVTCSDDEGIIIPDTELAGGVIT